MIRTLSATSRFAYTGRELSTGLYFYRARYYNPQLQRFISQDPLGYAGGSVNFCDYAHSDPTNLMDRRVGWPTRRVYVWGFDFAFSRFSRIHRNRSTRPRYRSTLNFDHPMKNT